MQEAKVPFEMAVYPGKTHSFAGPNIQVDLWQRMMDFLARRNIIAPRKPGQ
jgi:dipeptidyl aminopeptidase/acylaminoacyl peptidase